MSTYFTFSSFLLLNQVKLGRTPPARGGYGLPTAYFLLQAAGLIFERTRLVRWLGLGGGWRGWLFTAVVTVGPLYWLFHPVFVRNVILPMLQAIGATT